MLLDIHGRGGEKSFFWVKVTSAQNVFSGERQIEVVPGLKSTLKTTFYVMETSPDYLTISKDKRSCLLVDDEADGETIFRKYSQENCIFECHFTSVVESLGCVPWSMAIFSEAANICSATQVGVVTVL